MYGKARMDLRLRQLALVARDKAKTVAQLAAVLDLHPVHGSGDLSVYGLPAEGPMSEGGRKVLAQLGVENLVFAVGSDFLEVMFPTRPDGATVGFMDRRGGDTGYMVILQSGAVSDYKALAEAEGVRITHEAHFPHYHDIHLHPRDCGGALLSVARHLPEDVPGGAWYPAGTAWEGMAPTSLVGAIVGAELASPDPAALAARWSRLLGRPAGQRGAVHEILLDDGVLRFRACAAGEKEGFYGIDMRARDRNRAESKARAQGLAVHDGVIPLCGMAVRLVD